MQNRRERRRRVRAVRQQPPLRALISSTQRRYRDEEERQLEHELTHHQTPQPRGLVRHQDVVIRGDVPTQGVSRKRRDDARRQHHLRVDEHRGGDVGDEVRQEHLARELGDRHRRRGLKCAASGPRARARGPNKSRRGDGAVQTNR